MVKYPLSFEFFICSTGSAGSRSIECLIPSVLPQFPGEELGQLRSRRCEGEKDSVVSGYPSPESLMPGICSLDLHRCLRSPEPAAPSAVLISVSTQFWFLLLKAKLWLGFFCCRTPGFCAALVSMSCVLHQLFSLCLAGELHHVHKAVCAGAVRVIFAAVPRCSPQPSLSARISRCLQESCA